MYNLRPLLLLAVLPLLAACSAPSNQEAAEAETAEQATPASGQLTPAPQPSPPLFRQVTPAPAQAQASPMPRGGTNPSPVVQIRVTPAATPTPSLSQAAQHSMADLSRGVDELVLAAKRRNTADLVRAQQGLREALARAEAALEADESTRAKELSRSLANVRAGLDGDLPKLEAAQKALREALGSQATAQGTPSASATPLAEPIDDLERFAQRLGKDLAAFQDALDQRDPGRILSLQSQLLASVERAESSLEGDSSPQAQKLRSAAGAIRAAVNGDQPKFEDATQLLAEVSAQEVAGAHTTPGSRPQADVRVVAQELDNKLAGLDDFLDRPDAKSEDLERRRQDLTKAIDEAEQAIGGQSSPSAKALRQALGALRETAMGDTAKLDRARELLRQARDVS